MDYNQLHQILKQHFDLKLDFQEVDGMNITIETHSFTSQKSDLLHGAPDLNCHQHHVALSEEPDHYRLFGIDSVDIKDFEIECNQKFNFYILKRADVKTADGCIIFFHGLNEKKWDKYLPWAYQLAQNTSKAVILFPIAFHMNRAEPIWSHHAQMMEIANFRKEQFTENNCCSFVNAAISSRLDAHPQRIFWSGLQTYSDLVDLVKMIRNDSFSGITKNATIDLFGYSIGSFLSMIIKMANPEDLFKDSKLFCFCGGMTIDRMFPISKYIMDARAAVRMQSAFLELLSSDFKKDPRLGHFQNEKLHPKESWFKMMLRYNYFQKEREARIDELKSQIKVLVLEKDEVAPPTEALNTLQGGYRKIGVDVEIQDFPYDYSHMVPFPLSNKIQQEVTDSFNRFIASASDFYNS